MIILLRFAWNDSVRELEMNCVECLMLPVVLLVSGCGEALPKEPQGTPVELTQAELNKKSIKEGQRTWYGWHSKGIQLMKDGSYDQALYCFHQALKAWPKEVDPSEEQNSKLKGLIKHKPEATDTILLLGSLYMKMEKYALAKYYFEKFKSYFPYDAKIDGMIQKAQSQLDAGK